MPDDKQTAPLDLSAFDNLDVPAVQPPVQAPVLVQPASAAIVPHLEPEPEPERLVEIANLNPEDLAAAQDICRQDRFSQNRHVAGPWRRGCWRELPKPRANC